MPELFLAGAAAGSGLTLFAVALGLAELRHRARMAQPDDDTQEFPPILAAPRPVRGKWS
jgi:hypothetical protein